MSHNILQSFWFGSCHTCKNIIPIGNLYLETRGFGSWSYCVLCCIKDRNYSESNFESMRPFSPMILRDFNTEKYNTFENLKVNIRLLN